MNNKEKLNNKMRPSSYFYVFAALGLFGSQVPIADAALSVPDKYENLLYEVRERIIVEANQVDKTPSKSCNSLSGPFCHRVDPSDR